MTDATADVVAPTVFHTGFAGPSARHGIDGRAPGSGRREDETRATAPSVFPAEFGLPDGRRTDGMARDEELTHNQVLARLRLFAWERARGRSPGSDRLIRAGLDALLAGVDGPSVPLLAGLTRREEPDAPALFDRVAEELGIQVPRDPTVPPARNTWMQMRHLAGWIADGSLEATVGAGLLRSELVDEPHLVDEFATVFQCADLMAEWDPSWSMPFSALVDDFVEAAKALTAPATTTATHTGSDAHGGSHTGSDTGSDTGWDSHTNSRTGSDMDTVSDTMSTGSPRVGAAGESGRVEERRVG